MNNIKETLRNIIREEITKVMREGHQSVELKDVDLKKFVGKTVYHGTNSRMVRFIVKQGLIPRPDRYEYEYKDPNMSDAEMKRLKKTLPKELFVTTDIRTAELFAKEGIKYAYAGSGPEFRVTKEITPIVLAFKIKSSDKISKVAIMQNLVDRGFDVDPTEIVLGTPISVDRLTIVSPKGAKWTDFYKEKTELAASAKEKIKAINVILQPYNLKIKSKSTQTDQAEGEYLPGARKPKNWANDPWSWALRLSAVLAGLKGKPIDTGRTYDPENKTPKRFAEFFGRISDSDKKKIINILSQ